MKFEPWKICFHMIYISIWSYAWKKKSQFILLKIPPYVVRIFRENTRLKQRSSYLVFSDCRGLSHRYMGPVKRICVFEHSVMTSFNCACPAIQRGQGSGFLSEGSSWLTACMSEQRRFWRDCADAQARLNLRCSHRRLVPNSLDAVHMFSSQS